jgi:DNA processing protein
MHPQRDLLTIAVALFLVHRTPARVAKLIEDGGVEAAMNQSISDDVLESAAATAENLSERGISVCFRGQTNFPWRVAGMKHTPAVIFTWGNQDLLNQQGVGMCGSRNVSDRGLRAARQCGDEVAGHDLMIVSGYARGVDTETHLAALGSGGRTAIVLAEGIEHFKRKRAFAGVDFDASRIVVISQFPPGQAWNVGAAMARNRVIVGLGRALVVIEAGETGGTLDAGIQALKTDKPVLALEFSEGATPPGNAILHEMGAIRIGSRRHLSRVLDEICAVPAAQPLTGEQLSFI